MVEHPISLKKAGELLAGELGDVYRNILKDCCVPIYWFRLDTEKKEIAHNGTLTIVQTPKRLLGVTAAHVFQQYQKDLERGSVRLQLMNEVVDDLCERVVEISEKFDIATFALDDELVSRLGCTPLGNWPPKPPQEGKGIMIAGYPGIDRIESKSFTVNFGLFTVIGVARTVSDRQITWLLEREHQIANNKIPNLPYEYDLGGISGGPVLSWFESESFISHHCLSGIVVQHPNYAANKDVPTIERLIAIRADAITDSGRIV
jgi:hypothetical protein